jgi:drug/metabolite transporter (DMT)-like permease
METSTIVTTTMLQRLIRTIKGLITKSLVYAYILIWVFTLIVTAIIAYFTQGLMQLFQPVFIPYTFTIVFIFLSPAILLLYFFIAYRNQVLKPQVTYRKYLVILITYHVFLLSIIGICATLVYAPASASTLEQNTLIVVFAVNNLLFLCVTFFILYSQLSKQT